MHACTQCCDPLFSPMQAKTAQVKHYKIEVDQLRQLRDQVEAGKDQTEAQVS